MANPDAPIKGAGQTIDETGLRIIVWVFFSVASMFVMLRLTVRLRQNRTLLIDDCWIIIAWLAALTMAIIQTIQIPYIYYTVRLLAGRIDPSEDVIFKTEQLTRWQFPIIKLFWTVLWTVKASFMAVFFRFVKPFPILRKLWYCVAVFCFLAYVGCWLASSLTCSPPSDYFKFGTPPFFLQILSTYARTNPHSKQANATTRTRYGCRPSTSSSRPRSTSRAIS
jgi:hypothetical protein